MPDKRRSAWCRDLLSIKTAADWATVPAIMTAFCGHIPLRKIGYALSPFVTDCVPAEPTDQRLDGIATEISLEVWNG